jgi:vacuolar protein sorting-associated protein 13A/C
MYWNTDSRSLAGRSKEDALKVFVDLIAKADYVPDEHQYILKPVSGTGKIKLNKRYGGDVPKAGVSLDFEELGFVVDDEQYNNVLLMMGLFHSFMRQHEVKPLFYEVGVLVLFSTHGFVCLHWFDRSLK